MASVKLNTNKARMINRKVDSGNWIPPEIQPVWNELYSLYQNCDDHNEMHLVQKGFTIKIILAFYC